MAARLRTLIRGRRRGALATAALIVLVCLLVLAGIPAVVLQFFPIALGWKIAAVVLGVVVAGPASVGTQSGFDRVRIGREHEQFLKRVLPPAYQELRPGDAAKWPPSVLLRPRYGVVSFQGRTDELRVLERWCTDPAQPGLLLIVAGPGTGKTRLAQELCRNLTTAGWLTGFLQDQGPDDVVERILERGRPTLLVIDYAESRSNPGLHRLLRCLEESREVDHQQVRLLLLARSAGDWWRRELRAKLDNPERVLDGVEIMELGPVTRDPVQRENDFRTAANSFAKIQRLPLQKLEVPELSRPEFAVELNLHFAALDAVGTPGLYGRGTAAGGPLEPLDRMLDHESRYWLRSGHVLSLGCDLTVLKRVVAVATLFGARDELDAASVLTRVPDLKDASEKERRELARWHQGLYPDPGWLAPLQPDLIGEHLVAEVLLTCPELVRDGFRDLTPDKALRALTTFDRVAASRPLEMGLREALASDLDRLGPIALTVAQQTGDPIGTALALELTKSDAAIDKLAELFAVPVRPEFPEIMSVSDPSLSTEMTVVSQRGASPDTIAVGERPVSLREVRLVVATRRVDKALSRRRLERSLGDRWWIGWCLNDLGISLSDLGLWQNGLEAIEAAVAIHRVLADAHPQSSSRDLAASLNNLSEILRMLGRRQEALDAVEEAVAICRQYVEKSGDLFSPVLGASLHNRANRLYDLVRYEEALPPAEEAESIRRKLDVELPEGLRFALASSLNSLAYGLSHTGRASEALKPIEEAVRIDRQRAVLKPDSLAHCLETRGYCLCAMGCPVEGLESIEEALRLLQNLVRHRPQAFRSDLLGGLNVRTYCLSELGRYEEVVVALEEARTSRAELGVQRWEAFRADLANSLRTFGGRLCEAGKVGRAVRVTEEAVAIYRDLATQSPEAFGCLLRACSHDLADCLVVVGRHEEAQRAMEDPGEIASR